LLQFKNTLFRFQSNGFDRSEFERESDEKGVKDPCEGGRGKVIGGFYWQAHETTQRFHSSPMGFVDTLCHLSMTYFLQFTTSSFFKIKNSKVSTFEIWIKILMQENENF